jgi:uncharacterized glyoxalase superfamily metalloenzyme YdcJ
MGDSSPSTRTVSTTEIRHAFSVAMSSVYKSEVPLYSNLMSLVASVNSAFLHQNPAIHEQMKLTNQIERLHCERHGAIRLGTAEEMATMARFFAVMGMQPVGYYDLSQAPARLPVHSTCFRTLDFESLSINPFRVFVSLLRPEGISPSLRSKVFSILARRQIFSDRCLELISLAETQGGLTAVELDEFVSEGIETFKWRKTATVSLEEYKDLLAENPLIADIAAFTGPHINHLTPRTLDIDEVQKQMEKNHIPMKELIEGPPVRKCPILLRQTSFKALKEEVYFPVNVGETNANTDLILGTHTARFGEIEQRGAALTPKGRALYDHLVNQAWRKGVTSQDPEAYQDLFSQFPDTWEEIRDFGLAFFRYYPAVADSEAAKAEGLGLDELIRTGKVGYEPLVYEDFLPLSAAGIFRSNLSAPAGNWDAKSDTLADDELGLAALQKATGMTITDEFSTYKKVEDESLDACRKHFGISV